MVACRPGRPRGVPSNPVPAPHFKPHITPGPAKGGAGQRPKPFCKHLGQPGQTILDARAAPRFRGEVEPLDPVAGHIPGALNRPFAENMDADGCFKPAAQFCEPNLKPCWRAATRPAWCTTAAAVSAPLPNLIAMEVAGLGRTALYAGSWSEWCSDASRPVARS